MTSVTHVSHTEDVLGEFGFRLVWEVDNYVACVTAYSLGDIDEDNRDDEYLKSCESYLSGFVKWGGCTELDMGCPHWCSPLDYIKHGELLKHIYHRAFELMGRTPDEAWPA